MTFCKRVSHALLSFTVMSLGVFSFSLPSFALAAPSFNPNPFFVNMPMLPDGYFDGDILASDSGYSLSLDFSNLSSSYSEQTQAQGMERYTISFPSYTVGTTWDWDGGSIYDDYTGDYLMPGHYGPNDRPPTIGPYGEINGSLTPSGTGTISQTASPREDTSGSSDYSGTVSGSISPTDNNKSQHRRYRAFSTVHGSGDNVFYTYFVIDARNTIYCILDRSSSNVCYLDFGSTDFPSFFIRFYADGTYLTRGTISNSYYSFNFDNSGIYLSPGFPPPYNWAPNVKSRDCVFGKESLLFSYLHQLDSDLNTIHNDLTSLQSSISNSINNQTNTLVNTNTAGNFDPTSVSNMLNYGSLESNFHAPSTDQIFSTSGGTFADGMSWWRDRMNETLFYSGSPITGLATFTLTLGLAALVIGRRVSGGGTA